MARGRWKRDADRESEGGRERGEEGYLVTMNAGSVIICGPMRMSYHVNFCSLSYEIFYVIYIILLLFCCDCLDTTLLDEGGSCPQVLTKLVSHEYYWKPSSEYKALNSILFLHLILFVFVFIFMFYKRYMKMSMNRITKKKRRDIYTCRISGH